MLVPGESLNQPLRKSIRFASVGLYILKSECFMSYRTLGLGSICLVLVTGLGFFLFFLPGCEGWVVVIVLSNSQLTLSYFAALLCQMKHTDL